MLLLSALSNGLTMIRKNISSFHAVSFLLLGSLVSCSLPAKTGDNSSQPASLPAKAGENSSHPASLPAKAGENSSHPASPPATAQTKAKSSDNAKDSGPGGFQSKISDRNDSDKQKADKLQAACAAYKKLAQAFLKGHNDEQALSYLDHTIILAPKDPQAYYLRALALARLKRYDAAGEDIDKAIALYPPKVNDETKNCHALRVAVLQKLGQTTKVAEEQKKSADYLKGAQLPDITPTPQMSGTTSSANAMFADIPQKRWHPSTPLPMLDPTRKSKMPPQATQRP
jgi:hypothetical protein